LVAEERERVKPDAEYVKAKDEGDDVEGHSLRPEGDEDKYAAAEDKYAATEEPPDVEGHRLIPKRKP
jgi:hypothetical protein